MSRFTLAASALCLAVLATAGCPAATQIPVNTASGVTQTSSVAAQFSAMPINYPAGTAPYGTGAAGLVNIAATNPPPWLLPSDTPARVQAAGLYQAPENVSYHVHTHLDVFYNGTAVVVPGLVGIDPVAGFSPLHTHSTDGIIHIEAPKQTDFKLSQFMTEWGVSTTGMTGYLNGVQQTGDPGAMALGDHLEMVLVYGTPPATIPSTYPVGGP